MSTTGGNLNNFRGGIDPRLTNKAPVKKSDSAKTEKTESKKSDSAKQKLNDNKVLNNVKSKNQLSSTKAPTRSQAGKLNSSKTKAAANRADGFVRSENRAADNKKQILSKEQKANLQEQLGSAKGSFKPGASVKQTLNPVQQFAANQRNKVDQFKKAGGNQQILSKVEELIQEFEATGSEDIKTKIKQFMDLESQALKVERRTEEQPKPKTSPKTGSQANTASTDLTSPEQQKTFLERGKQIQQLRQELANLGVNSELVKTLDTNLLKADPQKYQATVANYQGLIDKIKKSREKPVDDSTQIDKQHGNLSKDQLARLKQEGSKTVDLLLNDEAKRTLIGLKGNAHKGKTNEKELKLQDDKNFARSIAHSSSMSPTSREEANHFLAKHSKLQQIRPGMSAEQVNAIRSHAQKLGLQETKDGKFIPAAKVEKELTMEDMLNADPVKKAKAYLGQFILQQPRNWNAAEMALAA